MDLNSIQTQLYNLYPDYYFSCYKEPIYSGGAIAFAIRRRSSVMASILSGHYPNTFDIALSYSTIEQLFNRVKIDIDFAIGLIEL